MPYLAEQVQSIEVTFRVFGANTKTRSAFRIGDGSPEPIVWCYYSLLDHFLEWGPYPSTSNLSLEAQRRRHITVNTINLWFLAGDPVCIPPNDSSELYAVWRGFQRRNPRRARAAPVTEMDQFAIHPNWLAESIQGNIFFMLGMSYHSSPWGMLLLERIGQFRISRLPSPGTTSEHPQVNIVVHEILGKLYQVPERDHPDNYTTLYNMDTMGHISGDCRVMTFWNWKWKALQERHKHGLENPSDAAWPDLKTWLRWRRAAGEAVDCRSDKRRCMCLDTGLEDWLKSRAIEE